MEELKNNISSSLPEITSSLNYETKGNERLVAVLYRKLEELSNKVHDLEVKKIIDETQIPSEILEQSGMFPPKPERFKRGKAYRPILKSEIEEAKKHSIFCRQQAKWLGCHYTTLKRYAQRYGIWDPHPTAKGKKQPHNPDIGKYPLHKILTGEFNGNPAITDWMVKRKMFRAKTFPLECSQCGYNKRKLGREYPTLLVDHLDGDRTNFKLENLRLLCLNCTDECGRGYLTRGFRSFDPDWQPNSNNERYL